MAEIFIYGNAVFFLLMGLIALANPPHITAYFAMPDITSDFRNEVRAVYGGFGVAIAGILFAATRMPDIREGILLTVAVALYGMASGRVISFAIERPDGRNPYAYCVMEIALASALVYAWGHPPQA